MWRFFTLIKVGALENDGEVFDHFFSTGINIFSQKRGFVMNRSLDDVPFSFKEGSMLVSAKRVMPC